MSGAISYPLISGHFLIFCPNILITSKKDYHIRTKRINIGQTILLCVMWLQIAEVVKEIEDRKKTGELHRKRVACAHCGTTWIELVGLIVGQKEKVEDLCLRVGIESENCQTCRHRPLECRDCGSKDVYETMSTSGPSEELPLSFKGIRKINRNSDGETS